MTDAKPLPKFSGYQKFLIAVLAFLQFTIILDFMIISPLGALIMPTLKITPSQFGTAVSLYAFSAGISGLMAAGFADRFDRKRLLLFFYGGFIAGTVLCGLSGSYHMLLFARVVTGLFGGVVGSVVMAIITDLFALELRGRVMGIIQTAFAASQILGQPAGMYFAGLWDWHAPFWAIVVVTVPVWGVIAAQMKPVVAHLALPQEHNPFLHLWHTLTERKYLVAFCVTATLTTGGYMLMPFGTAYLVNNVKIPFDRLFLIYLLTGMFTIFAGPIIGRVSDRVGKFPVFVFGSALSMVMVVVWTHLGPSMLATVIAINVLLFVSIFSRMIPSQALISAIPPPAKRGSFNAVNASLQQFSGALASYIAGLVVLQAPGGALLHFDRIGYIVIAASVLSLVFMYFVHKRVPEAQH